MATEGRGYHGGGDNSAAVALSGLCRLHFAVVALFPSNKVYLAPGVLGLAPPSKAKCIRAPTDREGALNVLIDNHY